MNTDSRIHIRFWYFWKACKFSHESVKLYVQEYTESPLIICFICFLVLSKTKFSATAMSKIK